MVRTGSLLTFAVIAGAAAGVMCDVRWGDALGASIAMAAGCWLPLRAGTARLLALLAAACAMCAWSASERDRAVAPPLLEWFNETFGDHLRTDGPVEIDGVIAADAGVTHAGVKLQIDVWSVRYEGTQRVAAGRIQVFVAGGMAAGSAPEWSRGRLVRAAVSLRRPHAVLNFGGPSPRLAVLRRGFCLIGSIKSAALVDVSRGMAWDETAAAVRRHVRGSIGRHLGTSDPGGIVTAILIGDRAGLGEVVQERLQAAGTYHVIAISGGNVALLAAMCFGLVRLLVRSPRLAASVTLATIVLYGWVVGGEASVARAVTAAAFYLILSIAGLRPSSIAVVRTTALALLIVDPLSVIDVGAWLSFAATTGIIVFAERIAAVTGLPRVALPVTSTMAAELAILPITASALSQVSVAGIILNLVAIPAMAFAQVAGFVVVALDGMWPGAAAAGAGCAFVAVSLLVDSAGLVELLPWLSWRVPPSAGLWVAAYYLALVLAAVVTARVWKIAVGAVCGCCGLVIATAPASDWSRPSSPRLRLLMVDVGQGDAILVQTPRGHALLVDAGGTPGSFDIGGRVVTPAVWAAGTRRLDWLVLSHGDRDHAGGAPSVLRDLAPREIWEGVPVPRDNDRRALLAAAGAMAIPWRTVHRGAHLVVDGVRIDAVHPPAPEWERQKVRNEDSMVLRLRYGQVEFLLTGDAGAEFERTLAAAHGPAGLRILKVGHHGSRTSTGHALVEAFAPHLALVSVGRGNLFGHPSPDVVKRLQAVGAAVLRTDRDGAIAIETDGTLVRVMTATGTSMSFGVTGLVRVPGS